MSYHSKLAVKEGFSNPPGASVRRTSPHVDPVDHSRTWATQQFFLKTAASHFPQRVPSIMVSLSPLRQRIFLYV